jgi:uncharacterized protein
MSRTGLDSEDQALAEGSGSEGAGNGAQSKANAAAWRTTIQQVAHQETLTEAEIRWDTEQPPFNYRWEHVEVVVRLALRLAELTGADREIVEAAAWLHDIRKRGRDDDHGREGAIAARQILRETDFPPEKIEAVADAIVKHVGLYTEQPVEPLEAAVLWDADKLSKLGATAVLHFVGYRVAGGKGTTQGLIERLSDQPWQPEAVRSFHTEPARAAGRRRLQTYQEFWKQISQEIDGDDLSIS